MHQGLPVDATFKRSDGVVLIDNERCIGCRFCIAACPTGRAAFNWSPPDDPAAAVQKGYSPEHGYPRRIGTVEKCDFCPDMAEMGMLPRVLPACSDERHLLRRRKRGCRHQLGR